MKKQSALKLVASRGTVRFGNKATTLERLRGLVRNATVLPSFRFSVHEWQVDSATVLNAIENLPWGKQKLIVRSSALSEDSASESLAGHFDSVLGIRGRMGVEAAVKQVIRSYGIRVNPDGDHVLVQPMLEGVKISGVAFSVDPSSGSGYMIVNYDDTSKSTSSVTEGSTNDLHTYYYFPTKQFAPPSPLDQVTRLIEELQFLFDYPTLDIEFAIDSSDQLYLFQCRPMVNAPYEEGLNSEVRRALKRIEKKLHSLNLPHPYLLGHSTVLAVMADWNPAEVIGIRPRPLALSLYRELICDRAWATQRHNYGYRDLLGFPLLISLGGLPYVDARVSFNSLIPRDLDKDLGEKLINHYLHQLTVAPQQLNGVEATILPNCYTFDLNERLRTLQSNGFSAADCSAFAEGLHSLTSRIISERDGIWRNDLEQVRKLEFKLIQINQSGIDKTAKISWLLEDCQRYGTIPFVGLTRAGSMAIQMLQSLRTLRILSTEEYEAFLGSVDSIGSRMKRDSATLSKDQFLSIYGHLRPGIYDILSPRFDEDPDRYFNWSKLTNHAPEEKPPFNPSLPQLKEVEKLLQKHAFNLDGVAFFEFVKLAIEGRDFAKFVFTRSLSDCLTYFRDLAAESALSVDDASFADISIIKHLTASTADPGELLNQSIADGRLNFEITKRITLPPLIVKPEDIWAFEMPAGTPNFVTQKSIQAEICSLESPPSEFAGKILFIPSTDPSYDWVFSHGIAGLVTNYGGSNSHMAIRAAELGIPTVIGCGEKLYESWQKATHLNLDCLNRKVRAL